MEPEEYRYLFELEESLWWFQGMKNITRSLIERFGPDERNLRILDAGCGTGGMLGFLGQYGSVVGIDVFAEAIDFARRRDGARLARASVTRLPFPDKSFDVVTEFEVINHWSVDDDQAAFNEIARVLRGGACSFFGSPPTSGSSPSTISRSTPASATRRRCWGRSFGRQDSHLSIKATRTVFSFRWRWRDVSPEICSRAGSARTCVAFPDP